jgi:hypothetical protein
LADLGFNDPFVISYEVRNVLIRLQQTTTGWVQCSYNAPLIRGSP